MRHGAPTFEELEEDRGMQGAGLKDAAKIPMVGAHRGVIARAVQAAPEAHADLDRLRWGFFRQGIGTQKGNNDRTALAFRWRGSSDDVIGQVPAAPALGGPGVPVLFACPVDVL